MCSSEYLSVIKLAPILASLMALMSATSEAFATIMIVYLQDRNITTLQIYFFEQFLLFVSACLYTILRSRTLSIHKIIDDFIAIFPPLNNRSVTLDDEQLTAVVDESTKKYSAFQLWILLFARALCGTISCVGQILSLIYIGSGDSNGILMVTFSLTGVIIGILFLKERFTIGILFGALLCIVGIILISQIFSKSLINIWGFLLAALSGFSWGIAGIIVRSVGNQFEFVAVTISVGLFGTITSLTAIAVETIMGNHCWTNLTTMSDNTIPIFFLLAVGCFRFPITVGVVKAYQLFDASRISLILTTVIPLTYVLQQLFFNQSENWVVYLGMSLVALGIVWIGYENIKKANADLDTTDIDLSDAIDDESNAIENSYL